MKKMITWALFDSGNGSYTKGVKSLNEGDECDIEIYPIGIDIEHKNSHFINLNLADYSRLFGDNTLFDTLDKLPKPNLIIASPPCESWSNASAIPNGNACWKKEDLSDSLFKPQREPSPFTIRNSRDYEQAYNNYKYDRQFMKRVNGELCVFNTIEIIKRYKPEFLSLKTQLVGEYGDILKKSLVFELPFKNHTYYNNYGYPIRKPTKFAGNIDLKLNAEEVKASKTWQEFSNSYNERSNIPQELVKEIFTKVYCDFLKTRERI